MANGSRSELSVFGSDYDTPDGTGVRDYLHVMDLARGHVCAIEALCGLSTGSIEAYNLGTGKGSSVLEVLAAFEEAVGRSIPHKIVERRPGDVGTYVCDPSKASKAFNGWKAEKTIQECCADTWKWQSANPNGFAKRKRGSKDAERVGKVFELFQ